MTSVPVLAGTMVVAIGAAGCSVDLDRLRKLDAGADGGMDASATDALPTRDCGPIGEICDGMDQDCDGEIDEDVSMPCSTPCGAGVQLCVGGMLTECDAPVPIERVWDVEADAAPSPEDETGITGDLDVINPPGGVGLLQFSPAVDLSSAVELVVRVHGARCASDCDPGESCNTGAYRQPGRMELHPLLSRFDEETVTWLMRPERGPRLVRVDFGDQPSVELATADVAGAGTSRAFQVTVSSGSYVIRAKELLDGDMDDGAACAPESPATELIVRSCPM